MISLSDGIPLGVTISNKIKSKIWSNEYIDLRCILPYQKKDPFTLLISPEVVNLQPNPKSKYPLSTNQWTDAFLCIRIQKYPLEVPHLLKYMSFVRELCKLYGDSA